MTLAVLLAAALIAAAAPAPAAPHAPVLPGTPLELRAVDGWTLHAVWQKAAEGKPTVIQTHPEVVAAYLGGEAPEALAQTHESADDEALDEQLHHAVDEHVTVPVARKAPTKRAPAAKKAAAPRKAAASKAPTKKASE